MSSTQKAFSILMHDKTISQKRCTPIYYTVDKSDPSDSPNYRIYYISNSYGEPFKRFELPSDFEAEKNAVADYLMMPVAALDFRRRGPRGDKKVKGDPQ